MPLITDRRQVLDTYRQAAELGIALPNFCAEDRETLEAILASALEIGQEIGVDDLPIVPAWTSRYPGRSQMKLLSACKDPVIGTRLMLSDLQVLCSEESPYGRLRVMPHLDHAWPWLDGDVMERFADHFASIMCDASEKPFEENLRLTADHARRLGDRVVIEGAVDEVYSADGAEEKNEPTTVEQARRFVSETGADLIVPNVGTEHRSTGREVVYQRQRARELRDAVGSILCIHGTSSLQAADLAGLPGDGFVKINIFTTLAVHGGQAVARQVLSDLGSILPPDEVAALVAKGVLGEVAVPSEARLGPKLGSVATSARRDAWFGAVKARCREFLWGLGYQKFSR